ncbi:hypothetical protein CPLU01_06066 [Colletotrichum plurivorum]|uniref:Uncharacterized protein n=1 Tax=Colletotrichum plurivorum TaxID=2175906 RepID=A0A8H6NHE7_9PEZI|nr:hypothetical protein CPLU01_06066 [Colletotrichum plurivorum]
MPFVTCRRSGPKHLDLLAALARQGRPGASALSTPQPRSRVSASVSASGPHTRETRKQIPEQGRNGAAVKTLSKGGVRRLLEPADSRHVRTVTLDLRLVTAVHVPVRSHPVESHPVDNSRVTRPSALLLLSKHPKACALIILPRSMDVAAREPFATDTEDGLPDDSQTRGRVSRVIRTSPRPNRKSVSTHLKP